MAVIEGIVSGTGAEVGSGDAKAMHIQGRPLPVTTGGHYRLSYRGAIIASQAANSRLFALQNPSATNLVVILRMRLQWMQTAAHTAAIEDSLDVFKVTGFTVVDTTNTTTPVASRLRTSHGASTSVLRGVTVAGAAAGMTGGTLTKDSSPLISVPLWLLAAQPTAGPAPLDEFDYFPTVTDGSHPLVLAQNEGVIVENRVALGIAAGSSYYLEVVFAEVANY